MSCAVLVSEFCGRRQSTAVITEEQHPPSSKPSTTEKNNRDMLAAVTPRYATEDFELHGKTIRRGDPIMLSPASANRDASVFDDPHRFDVTRDAREALTFGNGAHYCLGANLAMQELSFMLEAALEFLPEDAVLESGGDDWEQVGIMRRPLRLIVDLRR